MINFALINKAEYNSIKEEIESVTTPMYRPPEIVDPYKQYEVSYKVDVWMVGCVLYTLAFFTHPFVDSNAIGIADGVYRFPKYPEETQYQVSDRIKDLIRNFLTPNPAYRLSVQ
jgi:AP2-associated kinase